MVDEHSAVAAIVRRIGQYQRRSAPSQLGFGHVEIEATVLSIEYDYVPGLD
jgi:hypothetical protein